MRQGGPPPAVSERWQELLDDARAIADDYEDDGWETVVVPPGDVNPLDGDPYGLSVLAPGDVFETLEGLVEDVTFDTSHVYRAEEGGVRFLVVVAEATDDDLAVVVPAFLSMAAEESLRERALEEGVMYTHVRPLSEGARVTFTHEDPDLFF